MTSLATFVDRYTMRHVRVYPHPVERVWEAITDDEQVSKWMGFRITFDLRVGGICKWGPEGAHWTTEIVRLEPPTLIEHRGMLFELSPHPDGCRLEFTQRFAPGQTWEEWPSEEVGDRGLGADDLGGDLPGGLDTPWRPGFVGGFHASLDALGRVLDGVDPYEGVSPRDELFGRLVDEWLKQKVTNGELPQDLANRYGRELRGVAQWNDLNEIYRKHIEETIPAE